MSAQLSLRSKRLGNIGHAVLGNAEGARSTREARAAAFPYSYTARALNYSSACYGGYVQLASPAPALFITMEPADCGSQSLAINALVFATVLSNRKKNVYL